MKRKGPIKNLERQFKDNCKKISGQKPRTNTLNAIFRMPGYENANVTSENIENLAKNIAQKMKAFGGEFEETAEAFFKDVIRSDHSVHNGMLRLTDAADYHYIGRQTPKVY